MNEQKYYIVSQKHMDFGEQIFLLWRPNFSGYTQYIDQAGIYTEEEVRKSYGDCYPVIKTSIQHVEVNLENFLIPADEEALNKIGLAIKRVITYR